VDVPFNLGEDWGYEFGRLGLAVSAAAANSGGVGGHGPGAELVADGDEARNERTEVVVPYIAQRRFAAPVHAAQPGVAVMVEDEFVERPRPPP
jgi:hypothetical protein